MFDLLAMLAVLAVMVAIFMTTSVTPIANAMATPQVSAERQLASGGNNSGSSSSIISARLSHNVLSSGSKNGLTDDNGSVVLWIFASFVVSAGILAVLESAKMI